MGVKCHLALKPNLQLDLAGEEIQSCGPALIPGELNFQTQRSLQKPEPLFLRKCEELTVMCDGTVQRRSTKNIPKSCASNDMKIELSGQVGWEMKQTPRSLRDGPRASHRDAETYPAFLQLPSLSSFSFCDNFMQIIKLLYLQLKLPLKNNHPGA